MMTIRGAQHASIACRRYDLENKISKKLTIWKKKLNSFIKTFSKKNLGSFSAIKSVRRRIFILEHVFCERTNVCIFEVRVRKISEFAHVGHPKNSKIELRKKIW